jgi:nicotinate-nucleotide--dimethylbenzimidazole phosphoribosyltransferase
MSTALTPFTTLSDVRARAGAKISADAVSVKRAREHQLILTKPPGALGALEDLAVWVCGWQRRHPPGLDNIQVNVFAGNHGVCVQGVSPYPPDVTAQMVANFQTGGSAINQLCNQIGAALNVFPIDIDRPTTDFTVGPAMSEADCLAALNIGANAVDPAAEIIALGEMGIGNSTVAAAICLALYSGAATDWAGPGTGLDRAGIQRKATVIDAGLEQNKTVLGDPLGILTSLGGREFAAIAGAILAARELSIPVMLDGFICCAAAAIVHSVNPNALDHCQVGHCSAEPGHMRLLKHIKKDPLLSLGMRLGEGTGAAVALNVVQGAIACHNGMATFDQAGVENRADTT